MIGPRTLPGVLPLRIDDYSNDLELRGLIRSYNNRRLTGRIRFRPIPLAGTTLCSPSLAVPNAYAAD
jgi:hypothetical protein